MNKVTPSSAGVSPKSILNMLDAFDRAGVEMHSFMLMRHGNVCAEGWWKPFAPEHKHIMFSFSKSFTSTAIGFAEQEGLLSLEEKLVDIFPNDVPKNPSENVTKARIKHLLSMSCGHDEEIDVLSGFGEKNSPADFLAHPFVHEPGTHFLYNTAGTNLLCAILKLKSGKSLTEFLQTRLFAPLGMSGDLSCFAMPDGTEAGGFGYSMRTPDMAKFIQFVANKGSWEGNQLLNSGWFDRATSKQVQNNGDMPDWRMGYGYQFWRCQPDGVFRGDGAYGQYGIVFTHQDAALAITSAELVLQDCLSAIWGDLLPGLKDGPVTGEEEAEKELEYRLKNLSLRAMPGFKLLERQNALNGVVYCAPKKKYHSFTTIIGGAGCTATKYPMPQNDCLHEISFMFKDGKGFLECRQDSGTYALELGLDGNYAVTEVNGVPFAINACWRSENKLEMLIRNLNTASGRHARFVFKGDKLKLDLNCTPPFAGPALADTNFTKVVFTKAQ